MYLKRSFKISPNETLRALHSEEHLAAHVTLPFLYLYLHKVHGSKHPTGTWEDNHQIALTPSALMHLLIRLSDTALM